MNRMPEYYPDIPGKYKWGNLFIGWRVYLGFIDDYGDLVIW
jgi:hypothetical protein